MSIKDIRSNLKQNVALTIALSSDTTTVGAAIDTADFELGLMFTPYVNNYTDGTYTFVLQESVDSAFTVPVAIVDGSDKLIGTLAALVKTSADASASQLDTIGVISNLQFVRMNVVSTSTSTGADVAVLVTQKGEVLPV